MSRKAFDKDAMFWDAKAGSDLTVTTHNSSSIDLNAADIDEMNPGEVQIVCQKFTSGGSATVLFTLQDSADNSSFANVTPVHITMAATAFDHADLKDIRYTLPRIGLRRYVRLTCTIGTAAITGGTLYAGLVK